MSASAINDVPWTSEIPQPATAGWLWLLAGPFAVQEILIQILMYLRKYTLFKDQFFLFRTVSKIWNNLICQNTTKLPPKFWYWFARKSSMGGEVFIPLSFGNLTKIILMKSHQISMLNQYRNNFKNLIKVDISPCNTHFNLVTLAHIPIIKTFDCVIFHENLVQQVKTVLYQSISDHYWFSLIDIFGKEITTEDHLNDICRRIQNPDTITKMTIKGLDSDGVYSLCQRISSLMINIKTIKAPGAPEMPEEMSTKILSETRPPSDSLQIICLFDIFPGLIRYKTKQYYLHRTDRSQIKHSKCLFCKKGTPRNKCFYKRCSDNYMLQKLINHQQTSTLRMKDNIIDVHVTRLRHFMARNNMIGSTKWLDNINNIEIRDINYNHNNLEFIREQILRLLPVSGAKVCLHFSAESVGQFPVIVQSINQLLKNYLFFNITEFTFEFYKFKPSLFMSIMTTHPNIFFHNSKLRRVTLKITHPIHKSPDPPKLSVTIMRYYNVEQHIYFAEYVFTRK